ncbi:protein DPCD-like [Haliotis cracherodii]|uniref:protein DPCD-like n=1 Tax=Haliotis cracherodii TaxID=6455 RepID=UPI0039E80593
MENPQYPINNMASTWLEKLKEAQKTCLVQDGRRKIHFTFKDGAEMTEEYDLQTSELVVRRWRRQGQLGGAGKWETEVGEEIVPRRMEMEGMVESSSNPIFTRKDIKRKFQWRVRNLPYPIETYSASLDDSSTQVIIRTTNKKYYKKFTIPDMERLGLKLSPDQIHLAHANNTLIISYQKPKEILDIEKQLQEEFKKMKATSDGDMDCRPS